MTLSTLESFNFFFRLQIPIKNNLNKEYTGVKYKRVNTVKNLINEAIRLIYFFVKKIINLTLLSMD